LLTRPGEGPGFFTFGSIELEQAVEGNQSITFVDVLPSDPWAVPFWTIAVEEYVINGKRIKSKENRTFVDSGTPHIAIDDDALALIYEPIGGFFDNDNQVWLFPANVSLADIPTVTFPIAGINVTIDPRDMWLNDRDFPGFVVGGFQRNGDLGLYVFGDVWLRNVYAVFDLGTGNGKDFRFGFVPRQPLVKGSSRQNG